LKDCFGVNWFQGFVPFRKLHIADPNQEHDPQEIQKQGEQGFPDATGLPFFDGSAPILSGTIPPGLDQTPPRDPVWNLVDVLLIVLFAFLSTIFLIPIFVGIAHTLPRFKQARFLDLAQNGLVVIPAQIASYVGLIAFMVALVRVKYRESFLKAIRWNMPSGRFIAFAWGGGMIIGLLSAALSQVLEKWVPKSLPVEDLFHDTASAYMVAFFGVFVAPLVEELFFRGFLYPALTRRIGVVAGVLLTAGGFALIHSPQLANAWVPLLVIFMVGAILTVVRAVTQSVAVTVLMHMGYNSTLFIGLFIATQGFRHMEKLNG